MTADSRQTLLQIAKAAIAAHVCGTTPPAPRPDVTGDFEYLSGVFVTIYDGDGLRGCIGHLQADEPIGVLVARAAISACSTDPRFEPVAGHELDDLTVEISVLGPFEQVVDVETIEVGRHGLIVERGHHRGLLLPQVAAEWGWDRQAFLAQTCQKAGLPPDGWKNGATIWRFEAQVIR
jgi:AmmeMemoRadiSam system protein A